MNKTVNIFLVSFYFPEITEKVIRKLRDVTKYPFKLIVGDNKSINSNIIIPKLKKLTDIGLIDELFIYGENYVSSIAKHMFYNTERADITIITDYDSFINNINKNDCWLTDYVNAFNEDDKVLMIQYHAENGNLSMGGKSYPKTKNKFCVSSLQTKNKCQANSHFMALKSKTLEKYFKTYPNRPTVDGHLILFIDSLRNMDGVDYKKLRYDKSSIINLSSKESFKDKEYYKMRKAMLHGGNFKNKNMLTLYNVTNYEIYKR